MAKLNITSKENLTENQVFTIYTIKYLLEEITKSNNYEILVEDNRIRIVLHTTKFLLPVDKQYNNNYTHVIGCDLRDSGRKLSQVINTLHYVKKFKGMNTGLNNEGLPLHIFIKEVNAWISMCSSMHTYNSNLSERYLYSDTYNLNVKLKEILYKETENLITNIQSAGTDDEGLSYNSSTMLLAI